jgi:uncharacterized protein YjbI with pentapeptide repeats
MTGVWFTEADLRGTNCGGCDCRDAVFDGALTDKHTDLSGAHCLDLEYWKRQRPTPILLGAQDKDEWKQL